MVSAAASSPINAPDFQTDKVTQTFANGSVFLQDEQRFLNGDLILNVGGRLDTHREFGPQLSFRGAVLAKWADSFLQRLSYGHRLPRAGHVPALYRPLQRQR